MVKNNFLMTTCFLTTAFFTANAYADQAAMPDDHAPIGVMAEHSHKQGEWMLFYRYNRMDMQGNRSGNNDVSTANVLSNFMVAPLDMRMEMHMFGGMYGVNNDLTLMAMAPYVKKTMGHITRAAMQFETESEGVGDIKISGLYTLYQKNTHSDSSRNGQKLLLNLGASLPTGSIDERGDTPMGANQKLPYPMQLGSGTVDPLLGITYVQRYDAWSWGAQANTVLRFGKNSEGYRLGNEYGLTSWIARNLNEYASLSLRLDGKSWKDIEGQDSELNPLMVPTARTDLRGGERVDALIGLNLYQPHGALSGHRLAIEYGLPVYQRLDGPQLEVDHRFTIGWQWAF
ncbi:MAG: transporter [Alphaproteobacteria bacterium]|nr:transporter [Alphaproteobacteria bacterium]